MLRRKKAAAGRVWLLLRAADATGSGRLPLGEAARLLTASGSPLRICGRRQLMNLLAAGEGLFWQRERRRDGAEFVRLHAAARVAAGLGVSRLGGSPVAVPLGELTGTIGQARAHLYAAFHSGRTRHELLTGRRTVRGPIARETLCKLSGASRNSQRHYERRAGVERHSAIALGPRLAAADVHEVAWQRGRALFRLHDRRGRYGRPGAVYLAWQLPNEYTGPHATLPRGRQKRLNRTIADLFHDGMTGNGGGGVGMDGYGAGVEGEKGGKGEGEKGGKGEGEKGGKGEGALASSLVISSDDKSRHSSLVTQEGQQRQYYNSAKAALLARGGGERYWRHGNVWLWQGEVQNTRYEIRNTSEERSS
jgi:hypothetical protein